MTQVPDAGTSRPHSAPDAHVVRRGRVVLSGAEPVRTMEGVQIFTAFDPPIRSFYRSVKMEPVPAKTRFDGRFGTVLALSGDGICNGSTVPAEWRKFGISQKSA